MARSKLHISEGLSLPVDWITLATVIYGARGSGKTSLGRVFAEEATKARQRFCAIDLKGDWWGLKSSSDGKRDGIPVVVFGGDHQDVPLEHGAGKFVGETVAKLEQSCIIDLEYFSKGKQVRFLADFFLSLYDANREPLLLLLDEAQRYAPQARMIDPDSAKCLGAVEDLVKLGRKHGIGPVLFTQRGSGLNKEVSELCDLLVAFRTPGPLDQDRVKDWLDANTTKAQRDEVMGRLAGLETGTAVFASGHPDLKIFGVHAVRRPETFDSSATPKVGQRKVEPKKLAKPDIEQLKVRMAEAIARAEAENPAALRAKLAKAEAELVKLRAKPAPAAPPIKQLPPDLVEVPTFDETTFGLLFEFITTSIEGVARAATEAKGDVGRRLVEHRNAQRGAVKAAKSASKVRVAAPRTVSLAAPIAVAARTPAAEGTVKLSPCERAILIALMQHGRLTLRQAAIVAGYSIGSSTTGNACSRLRGLGLIEGENTRGMTALPAAAEAVGNWEPLPTGPELAEHWRNQLSPCEVALLDYAIDQHPAAVTLKAAAASGGYSTDSSTPGNAASKLRTLGLIEGPNASFTASERLI